MGSITNKRSDGSTSQKISILRVEIAATSFVSTYIQIIARIETRGKEAKRAAKAELSFVSSEIPAIIKADITIFKAVYITRKGTPLDISI
jgi:hypothetical protein